MACGGRSFEFFHSEHRQLPTMREFHQWPLAMINPEDAEKLSLIHIFSRLRLLCLGLRWLHRHHSMREAVMASS